MNSTTADSIRSIQVTPVILTFNEEPNLARTLDSLTWAKRVVVLDSGSTDATPEIAKRYPNVEWHEHPFESFGAQWTYAKTDLMRDGEYALALDADMSVPKETAEEILGAFAKSGCAAGRFRFEYRTSGVPLRGSLYPPDTRLFRRDAVTPGQVGHGHRFFIQGSIYEFRGKLVHDDRKSLERWLANQVGYSRQEEARIAEAADGAGSGGWKDKLRVAGIMPFLAFLNGYFKSGGPLCGRASLEYAYQRMTFECILALRLLPPKEPKR